MSNSPTIWFKPAFARRSPFRAFSLIEVLVVVALLSLIIIGLVAMFGQTQRAYRLGMAQVDILESGRMVTDLMTRDLSQVTAANLPSWSGAPNFVSTVQALPYQSLPQQLPATTPFRTNVIQDCFLLTRENQIWHGIGYVVRTNDVTSGLTGPPVGGVGTLFRYESTAHQSVLQTNETFLIGQYATGISNAANMSKLLEGVVHFTVRNFDPAGQWINFGHPNVYGNRMAYRTNELHPDRWVTNEVQLYSVGSGLSRYGEAGVYFGSNTVPASVEIELGVLEERALERAKSISDSATRSNFLAQQAGHVHLFRWRVPVRNVDPSAYQ